MTLFEIVVHDPDIGWTADGIRDNNNVFDSVAEAEEWIAALREYLPDEWKDADFDVREIPHVARYRPASQMTVEDLGNVATEADLEEFREWVAELMEQQPELSEGRATALVGFRLFGWSVEEDEDEEDRWRGR